MNNVLIFALLAIVFLFFLLSFLGEGIRKILGWKVCAICGAVSLTWFALLFLWLFDFKIDPLLIGILMGGSVVGIMYVAEGYFKKRKLRRFWLLRILIIIFGFGLVYFLLSKEWSNVILFVALISIVVPIILLMARTDGKKESAEVGKAKNEASLKLEKLLEDCC